MPKERPLRILALDVGFTHTGIAVMTFNDDGPPVWNISTTACIVTKPEAKKRRIYETDDKVRRVKIICTGLQEAVERWSPHLIAAELPSSGGKSAAAHASMGMAITAVTCVSQLCNVPLRSYNWDDIKLKATGKRTASKKEVQDAIVKVWPHLGEEHVSAKSNTGYTGDFEHIADAIGAGLCSLESDVVEALVLARVQ